MPNYSLMLNTQYKPFSYQDLLAATAEATKEHKETEDAYAELIQKGSVWDKLANEEPNSEPSNLYNSYMGALQQNVDQLMKEGLNPASKRNFNDMKARYAKEIIPIEQAYTRKEAEIKRQQETSDKTGGRTVFTRDARSTPLSMYMDDNMSDYGQINLTDVMNEGIAGGKQLSSRYFSTEEGQNFQGDYVDLITRQGLNPEEAMAVLSGSSKYPEFQKFYNDVITKFGANSDDYSPADYMKIVGALTQGINLGISYDEKHNQNQNWRAAADLSHSQRLSEQREAAKLSQQGVPIYDSKGNQVSAWFPSAGKVMPTDSEGKIIAKTGANGQVTLPGVSDSNDESKIKNGLTSRGAVSSIEVRTMNNSKALIDAGYQVANKGIYVKHRGDYIRGSQNKDLPGAAWKWFVRSNLINGNGNFTAAPKKEDNARMYISYMPQYITDNEGNVTGERLSVMNLDTYAKGTPSQIWRGAEIKELIIKNLEENGLKDDVEKGDIDVVVQLEEGRGSRNNADTNADGADVDFVIYYKVLDKNDK